MAGHLEVTTYVVMIKILERTAENNIFILKYQRSKKVGISITLYTRIQTSAKFRYLCRYRLERKMGRRFCVMKKLYSLRH